MTHRPRPLARPLVAPVLALILAVGGAACGGDDDGDDGATEAGPTTAASSPTASEAPDDGAPVVAPVGETFWFAGFEVTVDEVTAPADGTAGTVELAVTFQNLGADAATFDGSWFLTSGGVDTEPDDTTDVPEVPGGRSAAGVVAFPVAEAFTLDDAVVTVGRSGINQAVVPLGGEGELVALEPVALDLGGETTAGVLDATLLGGELRADNPDLHRQSEEGRLFLSLTVDVTFTPTSPSYTGGYAFGPANLAVVLPDGTQIGPEESPIELIDGNATLRDAVALFEIDDPAAGDYELVLTDDSGTEAITSTIPFTITADQEATEPEAG